VQRIRLYREDDRFLIQAVNEAGAYAALATQLSGLNPMHPVDDTQAALLQQDRREVSRRSSVGKQLDVRGIRSRVAYLEGQSQRAQRDFDFWELL
jgi:hypothetical protein